MVGGNKETDSGASREENQQYVMIDRTLEQGRERRGACWAGPTFHQDRNPEKEQVGAGRGHEFCSEQ